ncbi:MAG: hypothetical protein JWP96_1883 [Polaromonas sp.]|nr:hypothetical protein [Polaromonas sp.]
MASSKRVSAENRESDDLSGQAQIAGNQARNQIAKVAEATSMLYSATESIQQINLQLTQRAALRHHQIAQRLR